VFAFDEGTECVGRTRLSLPYDQDDDIQAVADANPNTVVVLNTGDPVTMPWVDDVRAVLETWYPGQEGAEATARLLLGEAGPSGKLPMTFPASHAETPLAGHPERFPGIEDGLPRQVYPEGVFFGYRWYDPEGVDPLFEFGRGLSYTRFAYSRLSLRRAAGGGCTVRFTVRNRGSRRGTEVPQVYIGRPEGAAMAMALKILAGFERVDLRPGERRRVTIDIGARELSLWSEDRHRWVQAAGDRPVFVGSSSWDIRLETTR
jgi:beta-glucosidase